MIVQSVLTETLHQLVTSKKHPDRSVAALAFAKSYQPFAQGVQSCTGGVPLQVYDATNMLQQLVADAYSKMDRQVMAATLARSLIQFWSMQGWVGGVGPGKTVVPGHLQTRDELYQFYGNSASISDPKQHAEQLAAILVNGVRQVMVIETPPLAPPVTGPVI